MLLSSCFLYPTNIFQSYIIYIDYLSQKTRIQFSDTRSFYSLKSLIVNKLVSYDVFNSDGTCGIQYDVPQNLIQTAVDKAVAEKDWQRLHLLFMGGGGEQRFQKGSGGLGTGCDASSVPLEEIIHCDFKDLTDFISVLLDHKARGDPPKGRENPIDVAIQLMERCKETEPSQETNSTSKALKV